MHDLADEDISFRRLTQHMQTYMDLAVLQFFNIFMEFCQIIRERFCFIVGNGLVKLRFMGQFNDFFLQFGRLF